MTRFCRASALACAVMALQSGATATVKVHLSFGDAWRDELDLATTLVGQDPFSNQQKGLILEGTFFEMQRIFSGYDISFHLNDPGGTRHVVDFAQTNPANNGLGPYGSTNVNAVGGFVSGATAKMFPQNFAILIQQLSPATRTHDLTMDMAQVASHELGHILGLNHQHKYANPGITPANYLDTGNLYQQHIMGVPAAPWGAQSNFNPFERAMLDIVGGTFLGGQPVVSNPVREVNEYADAGATPATALPLVFSEGESSGLRLSMRRGDLDGSESDVDLYSFTAASAGALSVNLFSGRSWFGDNGLDFDPRLRLLAADGTTVLQDFDDLYYQGPVYNHATYVDFAGFTINVPKVLPDPFMVNVPVPGPGTYYLEVSAVADANIGDGYQMLAAFDGTVDGDLGGDADLNGVVDVRDLLLMANNWLGEGGWADGDFDGSGYVDAGDLTVMAQNWQATELASFGQALTELGLPTASVPEPASLALLACAGLLARRRKAAH